MSVISGNFFKSIGRFFKKISASPVFLCIVGVLVYFIGLLVLSSIMGLLGMLSELNAMAGLIAVLLGMNILTGFLAFKWHTTILMRILFMVEIGLSIGFLATHI